MLMSSSNDRKDSQMRSFTSLTHPPSAAFVHYLLLISLAMAEQYLATSLLIGLM